MDSLILLKLGVGGFISIMLIGLSYNAAKSRTDKLRFEKENIQQQLVLEQTTISTKSNRTRKGIITSKNQRITRTRPAKISFFCQCFSRIKNTFNALIVPHSKCIKIK